MTGRTTDSIVAYADYLQSKHPDEVGFLTRQALREYAERGQIFVELQNDDPAAYFLFYDGRNGNRPRRHPTSIKMIQICTQWDARRIYLATKLVTRLLKRARNLGFESLQGWCAHDLDANLMWHVLGFTCDAQREGGRKRGRLHNHWYLNVTSGRRTDPDSRNVKGLPAAGRIPTLTAQQQLPTYPGFHASRTTAAAADAAAAAVPEASTTRTTHDHRLRNRLRTEYNKLGRIRHVVVCHEKCTWRRSIMFYVWLILYILGLVVVYGGWFILVIYPDRVVYSERILLQRYFRALENKELRERLKRERYLWRKYARRSK